jgi:ArsR family transcriptional regulator
MYTELFHLHSQLLKAMAHPKRLEIIHLLRDQELGVSQMQEMLGLRQANLSQHLQVLREAQVVVATKTGKQVSYRLAHAHFLQASDLLREVLIDQSIDADAAAELMLSMKDLVPLVHDPICDMRLSPRTASYSEIYHDKQYYFCAEGCKERFLKNPEKYA